MKVKDSSLQSQNPLSQAQASADSADRAVAHAESHPTAQTIAEAENALGKADRAADQAHEAEIENPQATAEVEEQVQGLKQTLEDMSNGGQR